MIFLKVSDLKKKGACAEALKKLQHLDEDKDYLASELVDLVEYHDVMWALRYLPHEHKPMLQRFALWCAKRVVNSTNDERATICLKATEDYLDGKASKKDLVDAADAAGAAACASYAADAAYVAAEAAYAADAAYTAGRAAACAVYTVAEAETAAEAAEQGAQLAKLKQILDAGEWVA